MTVVHWNPRSRSAASGVGRVLGRRVANFGDLLGPLIVERMVARAGLSAAAAAASQRLLSVGSILGLARDGDVVWGSGVNGKSVGRPFAPRHLDVRAVRGPLTRRFLADHGIDAPAVFGDPGLLVGWLWHRDELVGDGPRHAVTVVPNLHDHAALAGHPDVLDPRADVLTCVRRIAASDLVVGSSLHGVVVAESFGIGARCVVSGAEPALKYEDYYLGSGGRPYCPATSVAEAIRLGPAEPPCWDRDALVAAFPSDLWRAS